MLRLAKESSVQRRENHNTYDGPCQQTQGILPRTVTLVQDQAMVVVKPHLATLAAGSQRLLVLEEGTVAQSRHKLEGQERERQPQEGDGPTRDAHDGQPTEDVVRGASRAESRAKAEDDPAQKSEQEHAGGILDPIATLAFKPTHQPRAQEGADDDPMNIRRIRLRDGCRLREIGFHRREHLGQSRGNRDEGAELQEVDRLSQTDDASAHRKGPLSFPEGSPVRFVCHHVSFVKVFRCYVQVG